MKSIIELARPEIRELPECVHGGGVWDVAEEFQVQSGHILDFSSNINPLGPSSKALEAIKSSLWRIPFYPESNSNKLRDAIAQFIGGIKRENVIVGNGSCELIHLFAEVFIKRGMGALIPVPTFSEYERAVKKMGGKTRFLGPAKDFIIHTEDLLDKVDSKTQVLFLCNPNNPTSVMVTQNDIVKLVQEALTKDIVVFVDEDFIEFVDKQKRFSLASEVETYPNLFILRSFTKVFGLTGLRVGYGIACKDMINLLFRVKPPWNVNCLAQAAAVATLEDLEHLKRTEKLIGEGKKFLLRELNRIDGFRVFPADANFIFIDIRQSGFTASRLREKMLAHNILIRDCSSFRSLDEYYIRIAIRTRWENDRLLEAVRKVVGK